MAQSNGTKGLIFALFGFLMLTVGDAVIKSIAGAWPGTAVAALRYCFGAVGLSALLLMREGQSGFNMPMPRVQIARGVIIALATVFFFSGLFLMPLAEATTITFTNPIFAALFSAWFLKERAPRGTWFAIILAFAGVLIVLRPNLLEVGPGAIFPLLSAMAMASLMILNRITAGKASVLALQVFISMIGAPVLIVIAAAGHFSGVEALHIPQPDLSIILKCMVTAVTATLAHTFLFLATTHASAATVAPMTYLQLLLAVGLGWVFFGDRPDAVAMIGAALIVASGLFLWWNQKKAG